MDKDKLQKEIEELRNQRSELQQKMMDVQQQIDTKILEFKDDIPNFKDLYIYHRDKEFNCDVYMLVKNYTRTFDGLQLEGYIVNIFDDESADVITNHHYTVDYNKVSEIKEITKDFFKETIRNRINNIIDKID